MHRHLNLVVLLCGTVLLFIAPAAGQDPPLIEMPAAEGQSVPEAGSAQGEDQVVVPLSEPARRWIEDALRQQATDPTAPPLSSGDPVLDDVLDVIRRQGSLLDGSSLDLDEVPRRLREPLDADGPVEQYDDRYEGRVPAAPQPGQSISAAPHPDERYHVAESLLRAARELAALGPRDNASESLVAAMREQATMLLVDEYSQDMNRFED